MSSTVTRVYRRLRYGEPVVVVSGLPRSGTSMAMKMLVAGGMEIVSDGIRTADEDNPKGYFELERVKDLADAPDKSWLLGARGKAIKIISFLLKELPASNNYKVLFLERALEEVLASQAKMLANRGESSESDDERMRQLYENHLWRVGYLLKNAPQFDSVRLPYREVLDDPRRHAARINDFLGGRLDLEAMVEVVDRSLYRNRAEELVPTASS